MPPARPKIQLTIFASLAMASPPIQLTVVWNVLRLEIQTLKCLFKTRALGKTSLENPINKWLRSATRSPRPRLNCVKNCTSLVLWRSIGILFSKSNTEARLIIGRQHRDLSITPTSRRRTLGKSRILKTLKTAKVWPWKLTTWNGRLLLTTVNLTESLLIENCC